jgi:hypothetical protein
MFSVKTAVIALSVATWVGWGEASAQDAVHSSAKPSVVILPFSVLGHEGASALPLPSNPCAASSDTSPPTQNEAQALNAALASGLPGKLTNTTAQQLGAQDRMNVYKRLQDAPASALIVAGCVQRADPGNAAERVVGMNLGASVLAAHVQLYRRDQSQLQLVREFDVEVTGVNKLPPIGPVGLAVHGVRGMHETLGADVAKLSKKIAEQVVVD